MNNKIRINIKSNDTHIIPLFVFKAKQISPIGIIQIVHGMCEHHKYYTDFIKYFNYHGYDIYIHDQRGHGQTATSTADLGFISSQNGDQLLIFDVIKVSEYIKKNNPKYNITLLGHSMGALVAQAAAIKCQYEKKDYYNKLILTGTPGLAPWWQCKLGKLYINFEIVRQRLHQYSISPFAKFLVNYLFNFPFRNENKLFAWVTRDHKWLDIFLSDERASFVPKNKFWLDLINLLEFIRSSNNLTKHDYKTPILFMDGAVDPINNKTKQTKKLIRKLNQLGHNNIKHIIYPDTRHHLCIEINREEIFAEILINIMDLNKQNNNANKRKSVVTSD